MNMNEVPLKIGSIVTLKSNSLNDKDFYSDPISINANPDYVQPLMIISEVTIKKSKELCENTGTKKKDFKGAFTYKCIWFSSKNFRFEENYFHSNELNSFDPENDDEADDYRYGDIVNFKTNALELKKIKTSTNYENNNSFNSKTHLLTFSSPAFLFCGYVDVVKKDLEFDKDNPNKKIKHYPSKLVKIKAFNINADKFSEFIIPIEAITKIPPVQNELIKKLKETFKINIDKRLCVIKTNEKFSLIISPIEIITNSGIYYLNYFDLVHRKYSIIGLMQIDSLMELKFDEQLKLRAPISKENDFINIPEYIDEKKDNSLDYYLKDKILYITYKNNLGKVTSRFIKVENIFDRTKLNKKEEETESRNKTFILNSHCFYRNETRNFNSDRILNLYEVDTEIENILNDFIFSDIEEIPF